MIVVVMGVSGVGKTTVGRLVADELDVPFYDADDFHPEANKRKMAAGIPLTEADREPWLQDLAARIRGWEAAGGAVLACSALRRRYRRILGAAGAYVVFVFLDGDEELIRSRIANRSGHYMPPTLLDSQLAALERPGPEEAIRIDVDGTPAEVVHEVLAALPR